MFRVQKTLALLAFMAGSLCLCSAAYMPAKAAIAQILLQRAWGQSLKTGQASSPWHWMDSHPIAKISAPHLGIEEIILNTASGQALAFGPAHMEQTALPGTAGLSVIAAHKNTHFEFVKDLNLGDPLNIQNKNGQVTTYSVTHMEIVDSQMSGIVLDDYKDTKRLALVTCYPFDALSYGGPLRYIIYAEI